MELVELSASRSKPPEAVESLASCSLETMTLGEKKKRSAWIELGTGKISLSRLGSNEVLQNRFLVCEPGQPQQET